MKNALPIYILVFIVINFFSYFFYYRNLKVGRTEKGMFLYQLISLLILTAITFLLMHSYGFSSLIKSLIIAISLHSIYSLSFLEIWSLSEGGYSLQILQIIYKNQGSLPENSYKSLVRVGEDKKIKRLVSLEQLGLITYDGNTILLTKNGNIASYIVLFFRRLSNVKKAG
jgi:hypothetical protein